MDFTEVGSGPYNYTSLYQGSSDGTYTATLNTANDSADNDGAIGQSESVTFDTTAPTISDFSVTTLRARTSQSHSIRQSG